MATQTWQTWIFSLLALMHNPNYTLFDFNASNEFNPCPGYRQIRQREHQRSCYSEGSPTDRARAIIRVHMGIDTSASTGTRDRSAEELVVTDEIQLGRGQGQG